MSVAFLDLKERLSSWFHRKDREINTGGKDINTDGGDVIVGAGSVDGVDLTAHVADVDAHHNESHTVASHSDTTGTGAELDTLTDGSDAGSLHIHDARYFQESEFSSNPGSNSKPLESDSDGFLELESLGVNSAPVNGLIVCQSAILAGADLKAGGGIVAGSTSVNPPTGMYYLQETSTPAAPPSGFGVIWVNTSGDLHFMNDSGSWWKLN